MQVEPFKTKPVVAMQSQHRALAHVHSSLQKCANLAFVIFTQLQHCT